MLVIGVLLLVLTLVAFVVAKAENRTVRAAMETETLTCAELAELSQGVESAVGTGVFSQRCEVVGEAAPGDSGLLHAPESGTEAVWHRTRVLHRYWEMEEQRT